MKCRDNHVAHHLNTAPSILDQCSRGRGLQSGVIHVESTVEFNYTSGAIVRPELEGVWKGC